MSTEERESVQRTEAAATRTANEMSVREGVRPMRMALTGSTGFIGSHVLKELLERGHDVLALVRNDSESDAVKSKGAEPVVVDLFDRPAVSEVLVRSEGAIHTASPGDATSAILDTAMLDAVIDAFDGSGRPYIHISGLWVFGDNLSINEDSAYNAPAMVSWREPIERRLLDAKGLRGIVPISGVAYGDGGGGVPGTLLNSPRNDEGNLIMIGSGRQHWPTVHVADIADFFRRALEDDAARGYYVLSNGTNSTAAELTDAAAVAVGAPGAVSGSEEEARRWLGDDFAEVLLLDQATDAIRAQTELGWVPSQPTLIEELRAGSYRSRL
jgi:nucleoside-diphosphate-sugar epimerase